MNIKTQKIQPLRHMKSSSTREIYSFKCLQFKKKKANKWLMIQLTNLEKPNPNQADDK